MNKLTWIKIIFGIYIAINFVAVLIGTFAYYANGDKKYVTVTHYKSIYSFDRIEKTEMTVNCVTKTRWSYILPGFQLGCWLAKPINK
jgi:hypothetical protein